MPPAKTAKKKKCLQQTTLLGGIARPRGFSPPPCPHPMRMEVLICTPVGFKRKQDPEGPAGSSKESIPPPEKSTRKTVVESVKAVECAAETAPPRKRNIRKLAESDSEDEAPVRRKRRIKRARRSPSCDESCSGDEVEPEHIIESRLRTKPKLSQRDFVLLKLKRKRQGLSPPKSPEESECEDAQASNEGPNPGSERDSLFDGSSSDSDNSSEFIVDDDGSAAAALPMEFSMDAHEALSHQFKKIFQFMVHVAVRPPAERKEFMRKLLKTEEYFSVPLNMARRRITSLRESLVASSRWKPGFVAVLQKYPEFTTHDLASTTPVCDACRISGRRGSKTAHLGGFPYDRMGFKEDDNSDEDRNGSCKEKTTFDLGRFCAERTQVFHQLSHWEYELFKCIDLEVGQLHEVAQAAGKVVDDRDKVVSVKYARGKKPPKDLSDADGINDWLVERNLVDIEWAKIELLMDKARNLDMATKRGQTD
ncbi:hypothetical protein C8R44DRAFT_802425 [Mycena epipterygia]|nr:hypothetical protein C8R44DRAFT_802425 [Mycena epipterygia]